MTEFTFKDRSISLSMDEMSTINAYYERACTAEFIADNFPQIDSDRVWDISCKVRDHMFKYECPELEAIETIMRQELREPNPEEVQ